jgi:hypothetical protein
MDFLLGLFSRVTGNEEMGRLLFLGAIGVSTVLAVVAVILLMLGLQDPVQRRLALIKRGHLGNTTGQDAPGNLQLLLERVGQRFASSGSGIRHPDPVDACGLPFCFGGADVLGGAFDVTAIAGRRCIVAIAFDPQGFAEHWSAVGGHGGRYRMAAAGTVCRQA